MRTLTGLHLGLKMPFPRSPRSASCANIAPIPVSFVTISAAIASGRRWRARSSPPRNPNSSSYLNELYRSAAEKAGIVYVDIWDGFADEAGNFSPQGPDYLGQTRRLRTADGVYFTKFGARKLAHYVEREIERIIGNKGMPVALPVSVDPAPQAPNAK